jgi:hypothetical protein
VLGIARLARSRGQVDSSSALRNQRSKNGSIALIAKPVSQSHSVRTNGYQGHYEEHKCVPGAECLRDREEFPGVRNLAGII